MKTRGKQIAAIMIIAVLLMAVPVTQLKANQEHRNIGVFNVVGQGVFTVVKGLVQGKVKSFKDAGKMFVYGSLAGYGFYKSKQMIGQGHVTGGVLLANLSASITENVARGDNPLAYLGYSLGPVQVHIATPLAKNSRGLVNICVSPQEMVNLAVSISKSDKIQFRNGLLSFEAEEPFVENAGGWTYGIFPTVVKEKPEHYFYHEAIHVAQNLQTMSISPEPFVNFNPKMDKKWSLVRFSGIKFSLASAVNNIAFILPQKYDNRWNEMEAYAFASNNK